MTSNKNLLSIIVPIFNEEETIGELYQRLHELQLSMASELDFEIVFIDDGSKDKSFALLRAYSELHNNVKIISFSRNFGHQIAITAGMDFAAGDYVAIIDADLQDPPEVIGEMYNQALMGFDVVYGLRRSRAGETVFKKLTAMVFYRVINHMANIDIPKDTGDFRLISRKVVDAFKKMPERHRFVRGMIPWLGFKVTPLEYDRAERFAGETKYPLKKMTAFAINAILSFSSKPLTLAVRLGVFTIGSGVIGGAYMLYLRLFTDNLVPGLTSILLALVVFSGIQILLIGLLGQYISRIFEEVKGRPLYLIDETTNF